jgi:muramoyltetrapeptide carboxypeptidase
MSTIADFVLEADALSTVGRGAGVPDAVAVVGAGRWGKILCNVLTAFSPAIPSIVLVAERNHAATAQWLDERRRELPRNGHDRVVVSASLRDVLDSNRVEAAFVTKMASEHYAVTRQLLLAGLLDGVRGIVFGTCTNCPEAADDGARRLDDVVGEIATLLGIPTIIGAPIGHIDDQWTLPLGAPASLDADRRALADLCQMLLSSNEFAYVDSPTLARLQGQWTSVRLVQDGNGLPLEMATAGRRRSGDRMDAQLIGNAL